jgi:hypothetical protein
VLNGCHYDSRFYGNLNGQTVQWLKVPATSDRALSIYGSDAASILDWDCWPYAAADIIIINIGTNDNNTNNNITTVQYYNSYVQLINEIHDR